MNKVIMSILTVWMLLSSMFVLLIGFGCIGNVKAPYISHDPIRINSNFEFGSIAGSEGWVGDGSPGNPYIIEGYDINGSGYGYCIYIGNTTEHFVLRDSYLHEASGVTSYPYFFDTGIIMYSVQNGTITNNTAISNNKNGMLIHMGLSNTIINNTISSNKDDGIYFSGAYSNTIANNTIYSNNEDGTILLDTNSNTIVNNTIFSNNRNGIFVMNSNSNTFNNNEMVDNGLFVFGYLLKNWNTHFIDTTNTVNGKPVRYWKNQTGGTVPLGAGQVILANCTNVIVENQNVSDGSVGIELGFSSNNTIANNTASSNNDCGIYLRRSWNNTIVNNIATNNYFGINLR